MNPNPPPTPTMPTATIDAIHAVLHDLQTSFPPNDLAMGIDPCHRPRKKGLLIGINYDSRRDADDFEVLLGAQQGVLEMRDLLINAYGYQKDDIVVMIDKEEYGDLQPTRANIIRELKSFILDPQPGDRYFFHFCGHGSQKICEDGSEDDGLDEFVIPSDARLRSSSNKKIILDDVLHRFLVKPLTLGSSLFAVFDSCHSGTMLDLGHLRCNRKSVPGGSRRRKSSDPWWFTDELRIYERTGVEGNIVLSRKSSISVGTISGRVSIRSRSPSLSGHIPVKSGASSITKTPSYATPLSGLPPRPSRSHTLPPSRWPSDALPGFMPRSKRLSSFRSSSLKLLMDFPVESPSYLASPEFCTSPIPWCSGEECRPSSPTPRPNIVCVSACKDSQRSYEGPDGQSMTTALISLLKDNPRPSLRTLRDALTHRLHEMDEQRHKVYNAHNKWVERLVRRGEKVDAPFPLDTVEFVEPEISSLKPLDMDMPLLI